MRVEWPDAQTVLRRRPPVSAVELDDNVALYDDVGQLLILLNVSAAEVWERCDGASTFADLVRALATAHTGESPDSIAEDAWQTVRKLADLGLVEDATPEVAGG